MTTPRTMTQSQFEKHLHIAHKGFGPVEFHECLRTCGGVTIVTDPEPRPDFHAMTTVDLAAWLASNDPNDWAGLKRRMVLRAHAIADAKGMAR